MVFMPFTNTQALEVALELSSPAKKIFPSALTLNLFIEKF